MANNSGGSGQFGDEFGQWGEDVQIAVAAADAVGGLVGRAGQQISDLRAQQESERKLKERLGEWAHEAKKDGRWHLPMLRRENFQEHLNLHNGYLTPSGECTSTFSWAHLLYALNIRPGARLPSGQMVIDWKLPTGDTSLVETGYMHLEMPAEVLWHIINIYRLYSRPDPRARRLGDEIDQRYQLPFGVLSVKEIDGMVIAELGSRMPTTSGGKAITHCPFRIQQSSVGGDKLLFPLDRVMSAYFVTISSGISRSGLQFSGANYPADRARQLVERTKELADRLKTLRGSSWNNPYLVTDEWLDAANHIYRRITTDTGEYLDLPNDIIAAMMTKPLSVKFVEDLFGHDAKWEEVAKKLLRARVLLPGQDIRLVWGPCPSLPSATSRTGYTLGLGAVSVAPD